MAKRPIFLPLHEDSRLVREVMIEFEWNGGFAAVQKQKNVRALHEAAAAEGFTPLLEISTKSEATLGVRMSAFNLKVELRQGGESTLEAVFQGSKVFERGGPFTDIIGRPSRDAKRDERLRSSGRIVGFEFEDVRFPAEPKTSFYDWLYARTLAPHVEYLKVLDQYAGFTDIEFNPQKSVNCQARSCALFVALAKQGKIEGAISSPERWLEVTSVSSFAQPYSSDVLQGRLL